MRTLPAEIVGQVGILICLSFSPFEKLGHAIEPWGNMLRDAISHGRNAIDELLVGSARSASER